ncbi:MAG: hypothetical protein M5U34_18460 [Chloroflexi bacterium]|nr:hypothetical protein [Chloroflexota bacterium]
MEPEEVNYLYFNLHHVGPDLPATATLTLEAFDEASGQVVAVLPIRLERAATLPTDIARLQRVERRGMENTKRPLPPSLRVPLVAR